MTDYPALTAELTALIGGIPYPVANLANAAALLYGRLSDVSWAGFYLFDGEKLILGPFQGKPACIEIAPGRGVCGTAALKGETQLVPNVHEFPGHIACDPDSSAEIVVPLFQDGALFGVLDLDSTVFGRFTQEDRTGLEALARIIEKNV